MRLSTLVFYRPGKSYRVGWPSAECFQEDKQIKNKFPLSGLEQGKGPEDCFPKPCLGIVNLLYERLAGGMYVPGQHELQKGTLKNKDQNDNFKLP